MGIEKESSQSVLREFIHGTREINNYVKIEMEAKPCNEKLARNLVASFLLELNPSVEELNDIKTAISEAVTNSIVHGYNKQGGKLEIVAKLSSNNLFLQIIDYGKGIDDIKKAMQPFFTTKPEEERSGMGFTVMETFMDGILVTNNVSNKGVTVSMFKNICSAEREA